MNALAAVGTLAPPLAQLRGPAIVVGSGSAGRRHAANLVALGAPDVRVCSRNPDVPLPLGVHRVDPSALGAPAGLVVVANPSRLHVETARAAARRGAHLLIEKPLGAALDGIAELRVEVEAQGCVAAVGYMFRFHPTLQRVAGWLRRGAIGEVVRARAHWGEFLPGWHPGEDYRQSYAARADLGGGALLTLSHAFDYLRMLLGEVATVSAETGCRGGLGVDVEDTALVHLRFASGVLAEVSLDYLERPPRHELELLGREGRLVWSYGDGQARWIDPDGHIVEEARPAPGFERNTMFVDELLDLAAAIEARREPRCTLADGEAALRIALAALRSARSGCRETP
jgi:predicted dehydrogenase